MTTKDQLYLLIFSRKTGHVEVEQLGNELSSAMELYGKREREVESDPDVEVVLLGAPSLEALRRTHSSYFGASEGLRMAMSAGDH